MRRWCAASGPGSTGRWTRPRVRGHRSGRVPELRGRHRRNRRAGRHRRGLEPAGRHPGDAAASLGNNHYSRIFSGRLPVDDQRATSPPRARRTLSRPRCGSRPPDHTGGRILGFESQTCENGALRPPRPPPVHGQRRSRDLRGAAARTTNYDTVTSPATYRDNQWHQAHRDDGLGRACALYVDGALVGQRADTTQGERYLGYWRVGGDSLAGWPASRAASTSSAPSTRWRSTRRL